MAESEPTEANNSHKNNNDSKPKYNETPQSPKYKNNAANTTPHTKQSNNQTEKEITSGNNLETLANKTTKTKDKRLNKGDAHDLFNAHLKREKKQGTKNEVVDERLNYEEAYDLFNVHLEREKEEAERKITTEKRIKTQKEGLSRNMNWIRKNNPSVVRPYINNGYMSTLGIPYIPAINKESPQKERNFTIEEKIKLFKELKGISTSP